MWSHHFDAIISNNNNHYLIVLTDDLNISLAGKLQFVLNIVIRKDTCPMKFVPISSAVNMHMMDDALTVSLVGYKVFGIKQFE